jgi:TRAP-type C4-dicarboxylate transport system substrate-binding protein
MTVQELFDKAVHNSAFWNELRKDPAKAFKDAGVKATPEQLQSLKHLNYQALEAVASAFGGGAGNIT